ncbi:DUF1338 domain-containing protein [Zooshikella ganghwensis]|uniref:2-oxoadipate dioxygenase/decarboxylase n=1 Tax=Zooshikella ganghwensis TaxID=202772 RepID=A0A4P9VR44_9GAMM|nr:DUF1338 domain-containing protein [Zooshikella ganghwensis]RDH44572.1 DUF1338 domain-containing protein [Zooshikella ganghwensis]
MQKPQLDQLLNAMWQDYLELNPDAQRIYNLFASHNNDQVINDHIALRTFQHPKVTIDKVARPFLAAGYQESGEYHFPEKKLYAKHFQHKDISLPKVFISELCLDQLSSQSKQTIENLLQYLDSNSLLQDNFCYSGRHWPLTLSTYQQLLEESEYAAWTAAFGYRPNHFTVLVNALRSHQTLQEVNHFLQQEGFTLNSSGGLIKGSPDVFLEQSSTLANKVEVAFDDTTAVIPSCFYEFALRYPMADGELYQGFVAASADKIFESTNVKIAMGN